MKSNFQFLQSEWAQFLNAATEAESLALNVPRSSIFEARYTLEQVVKDHLQSRWLLPKHKKE